MKQSQNAADARGELKALFVGYQSEFRENNTVLHESANIIVMADDSGHELNELADETGVNREELRQMMRERAEDAIGESEAHEWFSHSDPLVFDK